MVSMMWTPLVFVSMTISSTTFAPLVKLVTGLAATAAVLETKTRSNIGLCPPDVIVAFGPEA